MMHYERILVCGGTGLIGSSVLRAKSHVASTQLLAPSHAELDLCDQPAVVAYVANNSPDLIIAAAGKVGGIEANRKSPADFIRDNLLIQSNLIEAAHLAKTPKVILFGSSCMYPRECEQPMVEESILSGAPEPTSLPYALSKLATIHMGMAYNRQYNYDKFLCVLPTSVFGPHDNFSPDSGHVLSALIARFHDAKVKGVPAVTLWGSGMPRREFIYSDDLVDALDFLLRFEAATREMPLNIGVGYDVSIADLAECISKLVGYNGRIIWDTSRPDGAPRKLLDSRKIFSMGWRPKSSFEAALSATYNWYLESETVWSS